MLKMRVGWGPSPGIVATWDGERWTCPNPVLTRALNTHAGLAAITNGDYHPDGGDRAVADIVLGMFEHSRIVAISPAQPIKEGVVY